MSDIHVAIGSDRTVYKPIITAELHLDITPAIEDKAVVCKNISINSQYTCIINIIKNAL